MSPPSSHAPSRAEFDAMTVLGIDHGLARIGVALKPAGQDWALPIKTLHVSSESDAIGIMRALIREHAPSAVVIGLPVHDDPTQAALVRRFARKAREGVTGVRWFFMNELLTSEAAEHLAEEARGMNRRRASRDAPSDELAAKLILESYAARLG